MPPQILVVGSSNTDMVVRVPRIPHPGETLLGGEFMMAAGGKGANQAVAAARCGGQVALLAKLGADSFGDQVISDWQKTGIDLSHVSRTSEAASGIALITVSEAGENSIAVAPGANSHLRPSDIQNARPLFERSRIVLLQLEIPLETVEAAITLASSLGKTIILNPAPAVRLPESLLKQVTILTPNESEAEFLTGLPVTDLDSANRAGRELLQLGVQIVIVTCGAEGALLLTPDSTQRIPVPKVKAIDTTAAGDVFNGALAVALGEGLPIDRAVFFATSAASLSVTRRGAQPSAPSRSEIESILSTEIHPSNPHEKHRH